MGALPDPKSNKEATDLKAKLTARLKKATPKETVDANSKTPHVDSSGGWRRMEIVEASSDEEEPPKSATPKPGKALPAKSSEPPAGFKRMQIVEEDESDDEQGPSKPVSPPNKEKDELYPDIKV